MYKQILFYLLICIGISIPVLASEPADDKKIAAAVDKFITEMVANHGFEKQQLALWFDNAKINHKIIKTIKRPAESAMPWHKYRNIFIQQERVDKGIAFWKENAATLARAEKEFGVPAELIVGLIGVETKYGRIKGKYDVFNSLYTLGFHFPRRTKFFQKELKEFLLLAREQEWTSGMIKGSYAGAMGYGQFMPSSYRMYAVDFDKDGKINLLDNVVDAIGSVANYIKVHGWKTGETITHKVTLSGDDYKKLMTKGLKPKTSIEQFIRAGVSIDKKINPQSKAVLIDLKQPDHKEYWLGMHNFYVISRYNPRKLYTMAVVQLTDMIKNQYSSAVSGNVQ